MNTEAFITLTMNPNLILSDEVSVLEEVITAFPYFQAAQVLHLKGLKTQKNFKYNTQLKKVAAYTNNRTVLFDFITADQLQNSNATLKESELLQDIDVIDSKVIEHLYQSITASEVTLPLDEDKKVKEEILDLGKPLEFDKNDAFSFNEWLQLSQKTPVNRKKQLPKEIGLDKNGEKVNSNLQEKLDLIEKFIQNKPKIKPSKNQPIVDVSLESTTENVSLMTETLARVYLEQNKYDKAIAAFKILSLKYPEKSSFFANQIRAIKKIQNNKS